MCSAPMCTHLCSSAIVVIGGKLNFAAMAFAVHMAAEVWLIVGYDFGPRVTRHQTASPPPPFSKCSKSFDVSKSMKREQR